MLFKSGESFLSLIIDLDLYAYMKFLRHPDAAVAWQLPVGDGTKRGEVS